jgi:hypothetical protein
MTFKNGLKAGAIGAAVAVVLTLLGLIPVVGCCFSILILVLWIGVGVLAGYFGKSDPMQTAGEAAKAGAVAGAITALGGGLVSTIIAIIRVAMGQTAQALSQIPPEQLRQLRQAGVDPALFSSAGGVIGIASCCCLVGILLAAALGAGGGALSPSFFKRKPVAG